LLLVAGLRREPRRGGMRRKRKTETLEGLCQFIHWRRRKGLEVSLSLSCLSCGLAGVRDVIRRFVTSFDDLDKGFFSFHLSAREPKTGSFFDLRSPQSRTGKSATAAKCAL